MRLRNRKENLQMAARKLKHVNRRLTKEELARHARIREAVIKEIPPKTVSGRKPAPPGIPAQIRQARESQGLTWYALAKRAAVPNQATIRDIEQGRDVKLSNLQAVAAALGLELELVEAT
jgi:DNA-binding XRE family transcriptional regulator